MTAWRRPPRVGGCVGGGGEPLPLVHTRHCSDAPRCSCRRAGGRGGPVPWRAATTGGRATPRLPRTGGARRPVRPGQPPRLGRRDSFCFFFFFSVGRCWWTTWRRLLHCTPHAATAGVREAVRGGDAMHMRDLDRDVLVFHTQVNQSVWPATAPLPRWTRPRTRDRHATHNKRQTLSTHTAHTTRYPLRARRYSYTPRATRYTPPR